MAARRCTKLQSSSQVVSLLLPYYIDFFGDDAGLICYLNYARTQPGRTMPKSETVLANQPGTSTYTFWQISLLLSI